MYKPHLLVIEDDKKIADLVCQVAKEAGFAARMTGKFTEIPSLYDSFLPEVIVLDILMPGMGGFEVLSFLAKRNSPSRVIILSGQPNYRPMALRLAKGLELAIVANIAKPFRIFQLRQILESAKHSLHIKKEAAGWNQI